MYQEVKDRLEERVNTKVISHTSVFRVNSYVLNVMVY